MTAFRRINSTWTRHGNLVMILCLIVGAISIYSLMRQNDALSRALDAQISSSQKQGVPQVVPNSEEVKKDPSSVQGAKGDPGLDGARGPKGDQGEQGIQGVQGIQGLPGRAGANGKSPECLLLSTKCVGSSGATGQTGQKGDTGSKGEKGDPGAPGEKGLQGNTGDKGTTGDKGDKGDTGAVGAKGDGPCLPNWSVNYPLTPDVTDDPGATYLVCQPPSPARR